MWPLERMGYRRGVEFEWLHTEDYNSNLTGLSDIIQAAQGVVIFRPIISSEINSLLIETLNKSHIPLLVDSDDQILGRFNSQTLRAKRRNVFEANFRNLLDRANIITVSTNELATELQAQGYQAECLPTYPDRRMLEQTGTSQHHEDTINVGFFGTHSHLLDLGNILPAIESVLESNKQLRFFWWGCRPGDLAYHEQVRQGGPVVSIYRTHLQRMKSFPLDIALVPLMDTQANRVKTPIKYFEYAAAGIPALYSNVSPYSVTVQNENTGLLVSDVTESWVKQIQRLIDDETLRKGLAHNAYSHVKTLAGTNDDLQFSLLVSQLMSTEASESYSKQVECTA